MNTLELSPDAHVTSGRSAFKGMFRKLKTSVGRTGLALVAGLGLMVAVGAASPALAGAATTRSINNPTSDGSSITGSADINKACVTPSLGCQTYLKVESRALDDPAVLNTIEDFSWKFEGGGWANDDGMNYRSVPLQSTCREYRTVVDTYDYVVGDIGSVGFGAGAGFLYTEVTRSMGSEVQQVRQTFASQPEVHCIMA